MAKPWSRVPPDENSPEGTVTDPSTVTTVPSGSARAAPMSIARGSSPAPFASIGASAAIPALASGAETAGTAANAAQTATRPATLQPWAGNMRMVRVMGISFQLISLTRYGWRAAPEASDSPARDVLISWGASSSPRRAPRALAAASTRIASPPRPVARSRRAQLPSAASRSGSAGPAACCAMNRRYSGSAAANRPCLKWWSAREPRARGSRGWPGFNVRSAIEDAGDLRVLGAVDLLDRRQLPLEELRRLRHPPLPLADERQRLEAAGEVRVVPRQRRLADRQRALEEPLGVRRTAAIVGDAREVVQDLGDPWIVLSPEPLAERERAPQRRLRLVVAALRGERRAELVEHVGHLRV